jgi:hypothetical protein
MDYNFNIWYDTYDPDYIEINSRSRVPDLWLRRDQVSLSHLGSVITPLNQYVEYMCPRPQLLSIEGNVIKLQQNSYAEIMIDNTKEDLYVIEKVWLRQYYQSKTNSTDLDTNFSSGFVYPMPWIIDEDITVTVEEVEGSPFSVTKKDIVFNKINTDTEYLSPPTVNFSFKRQGQHMKVQDSWGIVRKGTPVYTMTLVVNDIIVERVRDFYEKEQ